MLPRSNLWYFLKPIKTLRCNAQNFSSTRPWNFVFDLSDFFTSVFAGLTEIIEELDDAMREKWERLWMVSNRRSGPIHPLIYSHPITGKQVCIRSQVQSKALVMGGYHREAIIQPAIPAIPYDIIQDHSFHSILAAKMLCPKRSSRVWCMYVNLHMRPAEAPDRRWKWPFAVTMLTAHCTFKVPFDLLICNPRDEFIFKRLRSLKEVSHMSKKITIHFH